MGGRLLIGLVVVLLLAVAGIGALVVSGTIAVSSLPLLLHAITGKGGSSVSAGEATQRFTLPEGFSLSLYADNLPNARFLRFTSAGDLLVSRARESDIVLLERDNDRDGSADSAEVLLSGLNRPLGMDFKDGYLYYAEANRVSKIRFNSASGTVVGKPEVIIDGLSDDGNHPYKTIRFGSDGKLYLSQGSTCNVCVEEDPRRGTMMRFDADGSNGQILATGLRNSVGFAWAPWSGDLYATDNGRDLLGDDFPPCELNLIEAGAFYGWPWYNGNNIEDPDMGADPQRRKRTPVAPVHSFRAHNAPLGIAFINASAWPAAYARSALVALHGSWNRSEPDGYKVVSLHWSESGIEERDFLAGFNLDGDIVGRPVDVAQGPHGAVYISDDYAGAIYRVAYAEDAGSDVLALSKTPSTPTPLPRWVRKADLDNLAAQGSSLYQQLDCSSCHEHGESPRRLDHLRGQKDYARVLAVLQSPPPPMPALPISELQRRALAVYLLRKPD
ncbi:sorbosone dehydrogenase family protein [Pseudomaricurvus alcaniphilus]|uniref:PQQ-dependent sugar dehydrogenase n=1 Tax=Pseudomaricurvus alcaniphilus TaxID=1166482 RepID=UPI00140B88D6|nr:PQQ-dependent sugar dehydrogenase [Pseudomaricurvus alcaniphilus]NHN37266.1 sorbosone dehydrogenase family protein [Pseudomaricurvus alcaniphilus]